MFRNPIYMILFLLLIIIAGLFEMSYLNGLEENIEQLEGRLSQELRELNSFKSSYGQLIGTPLRGITFIDMRELETSERKMRFLEDFFKNYASNFSLQAESKVDLTNLPDFMQSFTYTGDVIAYRVQMEIQNYSGISALVGFIGVLKNFPVLFDDLEIGTGGEKKAFLRLSMIFFETYGE
ncbi:MAG: hypothetical protein ABIM20_04760 [candidate division WOR-3 bacterium]